MGTEQQTEILESVPLLNERAARLLDLMQYDKAIEAFDEVLRRDESSEFALQMKIAGLRLRRRFKEAGAALAAGLARLPESVRLLNERGALLFDLRQYDEAIKAFDEVLRRDERNERALQIKAAALRLQEHFKEAGEVLTAGLARLPQSVRLLNERDALLWDLQMKITALRLQERPKEAAEVLTSALAGLPLSERGELFFDLRQYDKAIEAFEEVLSCDERNDRALQMKATALRLRLRFKEAGEALTAGLARLPRSVRLLNERGALLHDLRQYDKAIEAFDEVLRQDERNERGLQMKAAALRLQVMRGSTLLYRSQYDKAIEVFDEVLRRDEGDEFALRMKVTTLRLQERFKEAGEALTTALAHLPQSVRLLNERGALFFDLRQHDKAIESFDEVLRRDERNERALRMKLAALRLQGRSKEAEEALTTALAHLPLSERGVRLLDLMQYDKAIESFDEVLRRDESNQRALHMKITALRLGRRFKEAGEALTTALARLPESVPLLSERGALFFDLRQYDKVIEASDEVLRRDERHEFALQMKVEALRLQERFKEAEEALTAGLARLPQSVRLLNERGALFFDLRQYDQAIEVFDEVLGRDDRDEFALRMKAVALYREERVAESEGLMKLSVARFPWNSALLHELGQLYLSEDNGERAREVFDQAIAADEHTVFPLVGKAAALRKLGLRYEAEKLLRDAEARFSDDADYIAQLAWEYISAGNHKAAKRLITEGARLRPHNADWFNTEGGISFEEGNYSAAEQAFRRALTLRGSDSAISINLAWALLRQEDQSYLKEAENLCATALERNPRNPKAHACLGVIWFKKGHPITSEYHLRTAQQYDRHAGAGADLASLLIYLGQHPEAEEILKTNIHNDPHDYRSHLELGKLYFEPENMLDCLKHLRRSLSIDPGNSSAISALAIALMRKGDFPAAETILKDGIKRVNPSERHQLHLTLAQLTLQAAESTDDSLLYKEALANVNAAVKINGMSAEAFFLQGLIRYKMEDAPGAIRSFRRCLKLHRGHSEAERNLKRIQQVRRADRIRSGGSMFGGVLVALVALVQLSGLWLLYWTKHIAESSLLILAPILLGMVMLAFVLPYVIKLKMPGLEAEISRPAQSLTSGPSGVLSLDTRAPSLAVGPR